MSWDDHDPADAFVIQAGLLTERLSRIALDVNVALCDVDGAARARLERAVTGLDRSINDVRLMAVHRLGMGREGADRRQGDPPRHR